MRSVYNYYSILGSGFCTIGINRSSTQECIVGSKRPKLQDCTVHLYPPQHGEDEVSNGRNLELWKAETAKSKPRTEVLKDLMSQTFPNRLDAYRISLNNGPGVYYLYSLPAPGVKLRQAFI